MKLLRTALAAGAAALALGAGGLAAGPAAASTTGCAFTNGCATLNGVDAAGHAVSMDAKYQNPAEILIGYPDIPGDGATNFDAVLHFTTSHTPVFADTDLLVQSPANNAVTIPRTYGCITDATPDLNLSGSQFVPAAGHTTTWSIVTGVAGAPSLTINSATGLLSDPNNTENSTGTSVAVQVSDGFGDIANAVVPVKVTAGVVTVTPITAENCLTGPLGTEHATELQLTATDRSVPGAEPVTWSASGLPAGLSIDPVTGEIVNGTAASGSYGVKITAKDSSGASSTLTFTLQVDATESSVAGNTPFYTFVYAKNGNWSNQCVTDFNGSGALKLVTCTLGKNRYQDFFALSGGSPSQDLTNGNAFYLQDWLAHIVNGADSCLTDPSSLVPGTPESDAADEAGAPVFGRQLRVDGSCSTVPDQFRWAS